MHLISIVTIRLCSYVTLIVPHLIHAHINALGQVPLNVLQEYIGRGASNPLDLHESSVCADLILNTVLLIDVW